MQTREQELRDPRLAPEKSGLGCLWAKAFRIEAGHKSGGFTHKQPIPKAILGRFTQLGRDSAHRKGRLFCVSSVLLLFVISALELDDRMNFTDCGRVVAQLVPNREPHHRNRLDLDYATPRPDKQAKNHATKEAAGVRGGVCPQIGNKPMSHRWCQHVGHAFCHVTHRYPIQPNTIAHRAITNNSRSTYGTS